MEFEEQLLEIVMIMEELTRRNAALVSVVRDLLEQHRRQGDMEDCGRRCSYPDKFPEWDRAWENVEVVLDG